MRFGIISDIHGNLEALNAVLEVLSRERIDKYICVGDIIGYGANPIECITYIKDLNPLVVLGNHEAACLGVTDVRYFNPIAREAVMWTKNHLIKENLDFLRKLLLVYVDKNFTLVHGTLQEPEFFHYMFDIKSAFVTFNLMTTRLCFIGHSHIPGIFVKRNGEIRYGLKEKYVISDDEKIIVNAGSVGQPRDGDPRSSYSIYDSEENIVEIKRVAYNVELAQRKILTSGLPPALAYRLKEGV